MSARHGDRLWMIAGMAVIALLAAATWFLAISPQRTEASDLRAETQTAQAQADDLRARIVELTADKAKLSVLKATLEARQNALPADSGVPAFLRQLQTADAAYGMNVSGLTVGEPVPDEAVPGVWSVPIELTAQGTAKQLSVFLKQLQSADQQRAVLIQAADLGPDDEGATTGDLLLTLTVKTFVAPPAGADAPTITAD